MLPGDSLLAATVSNSGDRLFLLWSVREDLDLLIYGDSVLSDGVLDVEREIRWCNERGRPVARTTALEELAETRPELAGAAREQAETLEDS